MRKVTAITNRVIVKRALKSDRTASGLHLITKEVMDEGRVLSVGPQVTEVKEGDTVYFGESIGMDIKEDTLVMKEEDILGVKV